MENRLTYILNKYLSNSKELKNIKKFILNTGVEFTEEKYNFLPGWTVISNCHKLHHKDPYIRNLEEELFILHDALHQLFPMYVDHRVEQKYIMQQIVGEFFIFSVTEYYVQTEMLKHCDEAYKNYILNVRCYYSMLDTLLKGSFKNTVKLISKFLCHNISDLSAADFDIFIKIKNMFLEDGNNSKSNFKYLDLLLENSNRENINSDKCVFYPGAHYIMFKSIINNNYKDDRIHKNLNIKKQIKEWI